MMLMNRTGAWLFMTLYLMDEWADRHKHCRHEWASHSQKMHIQQKMVKGVFVLKSYKNLAPIAYTDPVYVHTACFGGFSSLMDVKSHKNQLCKQ